jgi:hypothetical protein
MHNCSLMRIAAVAAAVAAGAGGTLASGTWSVGPGERIAARSMTFCRSRILPGHGFLSRVSMTAVGIVSIRRPILRAMRRPDDTEARSGPARLGGIPGPLLGLRLRPLIMRTYVLLG